MGRMRVRRPNRAVYRLIWIISGTVLVAGVGIQLLAAQSQRVSTPPVAQFAADPSGVREATIKGVHHHLSLVTANATGRQLTIDSVVVSTDRITLLYHATGIKCIDFSQISQIPLYRTEPPTLIVISVDGHALRPMDGATEGPHGGTRWGYFVVAWTGTSPNHIHVSIKRIEGDLLAKWEVDTDL